MPIIDSSGDLVGAWTTVDGTAYSAAAPGTGTVVTVFSQAATGQASIAATPVVLGLTNLVDGTPGDGEVPVYSASTSSWGVGSVAGTGGGATELSDLTDVDTTGVTDGQGLYYDDGTGVFLPADPPASGATALSDLTDVDTTGVADGQGIYYDSGTGVFLPADPPAGSGAVDSVDGRTGTVTLDDLYQPTAQLLMTTSSETASADTVVAVNLSGGDTTLTLPAGSDRQNRMLIVDAAQGDVDLVMSGSDMIDNIGQTTFTVGVNQKVAFLPVDVSGLAGPGVSLWRLIWGQGINYDTPSVSTGNIGDHLELVDVAGLKYALWAEPAYPEIPEDPLINVQDYGAVGDGVTLDSDAFDAATAAASGGGTIYAPAGTYLLNRPVFMPSNTVLYGDGTSTVLKKIDGLRIDISDGATIGSTTLTLSTVTGLSVGDYLAVKSIDDEGNAASPWAADFGKITDIAGSVVTIDTPLRSNFMDNQPYVQRTWPLITNGNGIVGDNDPNENIVVRDLTLDHNYTDGEDDTSQYRINFTQSTLHWNEVRGSIVDRVTFLNACADAYSDQARSGPGNTIQNSTIKGACHHAIHFGTDMEGGGRALNNRIEDCGNIAQADSLAVFYCLNVSQTVVAYNTVVDSWAGFGEGDYRPDDEGDWGNIIIGNTLSSQTSGATTRAIDPGWRSVISGNVITDWNGAGIRADNDCRECVIVGNMIEIVGPNAGIELFSGAHNTVVANNVVTSATTGTGGTGIVLGGTAAIPVTGCNLSDNVIKNFAIGIAIAGCKFVKCENTVFKVPLAGYGYSFSSSAPSTGVSITTRHGDGGYNVINEGELGNVTRLTINGLGQNGAANPATSGAWYDVTKGSLSHTLLQPHHGQLVHWTDEYGGHHFSIFNKSTGAGTSFWQDLGALDYATVTLEPNGFPDRTSTTVTLTDGTRTVSIAPTASSFTYYADGKAVTKSAATTAQFADTDGLHFVYFNGATLTASTTPWDLTDSTIIPVAAVLWDATNDTGILIEERHGIVMDRDTHLLNHSTRGTQFVSGGVLSGYNLQPTTPADADNNFGISTTVIADEDIRSSLSALTDGTAIGRVWRSGSSGPWRWDTSSSFPITGGTDYIAYNQNSGGTWSLTSLSANQFINYWLIAVPALTTAYRYILVPGQTVHASLAAAQSESIGTMDWGSVPFTEMAPLAKVTYRTNAAYTTIGKCRIEAIAALRGESVTVEMSDVTITIVDEDDMASDSDTAVPTQQSVKAYVDNTAVTSSDGSINDIVTVTQSEYDALSPPDPNTLYLISGA